MVILSKLCVNFSLGQEYMICPVCQYSSNQMVIFSKLFIFLRVYISVSICFRVPQGPTIPFHSIIHALKALRQFPNGWNCSSLIFAPLHRKPCHCNSLEGPYPKWKIQLSSVLLLHLNIQSLNISGDGDIQISLNVKKST